LSTCPGGSNPLARGVSFARAIEREIQLLRAKNCGPFTREGPTKELNSRTSFRERGRDPWAPTETNLSSQDRVYFPKTPPGEKERGHSTEGLRGPSLGHKGKKPPRTKRSPYQGHLVQVQKVP